MVGTAAWGQVADRFGRKGAGYAIAAPVLAGWLLIVASLGGLNGFFAGRFLLGLGASGCFVLVPLYVSEIADDGVRGFLGSFLILFVNLGVLVAYVGGACLDYVPFGLLCAAAPLLFVLTYFRLPETPIYLASKKRHREAAASLAYFRGHSAAQELAASYASTLLVERSGRRPLLLFSFSVMALSLIILGIYFMFLLGNTTWGLLPVACLCVYVVAYAMGAGPVPYVVMSETFSPQIRATATSIIVLWGTAMAFCTIKVFPHLNEHLGQAGAFWFFAAFCLFGLGFTWTILPETKGRSLEDILRELNGGQDYKQREEAKETLKEFI
ncbi:hypothetical protein AAG570_003568 [Ranatra chinensis]|uniref:Major facilitator superfamily (MFS) profile domain-containing protein n=1 Tax=Ranatra chinensis TaxID=642074 RepID=A0ABD0Y424_9HEMI